MTSAKAMKALQPDVPQKLHNKLGREKLTKSKTG